MPLNSTNISFPSDIDCASKSLSAHNSPISKINNLYSLKLLYDASGTFGSFTLYTLYINPQ